METVRCDDCWGAIYKRSDGSFVCEVCGRVHSQEEIEELVRDMTDDRTSAFMVDTDGKVLTAEEEEPEPDYSQFRKVYSEERFTSPYAQEYADIRARNTPVKGMMIDCGKYIRTADGRTVWGRTEGDLLEIFKSPEWHDIVQLAYGDQLIGLRADGAAFAVPKQRKGGSDRSLIPVFDPWDEIIEIAVATCEPAQVVCGLRRDGTVLAQCDNPEENEISSQVTKWFNVEKLYGAYKEILAIRRDGTVVSTKNDYSYLRDVVAIAVRKFNWDPIFLHSDGTVSFSRSVVEGEDFYRVADDYAVVRNWTDLADIAYGGNCLIGMKRDGSVVARYIRTNHQSLDQERCQVASQWRDIVAVFGEHNDFVGVQIDGTFVYVPTNARYGMEEISVDRLFSDIQTLERELHDSKYRKHMRETRKQKAALLEEKAALEAQLPELTGFFFRSRRRTVQDRLMAIDRELQTLE